MNRKLVFFALKFFLIYAVIQFLIYAIDLSFLQNSIAEFLGSILGIQVIGNNLLFNGAVFSIAPNCTGLVSAGILAATIFSLKKPEMKFKLMVFLIGSVLLFVINLIRLYFVILSGIYFNLANEIHLISWLAMTVFILGIWFYSMKKIVKIDSFEGFL